MLDPAEFPDLGVRLIAGEFEIGGPKHPRRRKLYHKHKENGNAVISESYISLKQTVSQEIEIEPPTKGGYPFLTQGRAPDFEISFTVNSSNDTMINKQC